MNKGISILLFCLITLLIFSCRAFACGFCAFAAFDSFMPPIYFWCTLAVLWFLTVNIITVKYSITVVKYLSPFASIIIVISALIIAIWGYGPISLLPLALLPIIISILALINLGPFRKNILARNTIVYIGIVVVVLCVIGLVWSKQILMTRSDAKFYIQWSGTMSGRALMAEFKRREPASITDYRYIVDHGSNGAAADAARRIGIIGDPDIDMPRLKAVLTRYKLDDFERNWVQEAIDSLNAKKMRKAQQNNSVK